MNREIKFKGHIKGTYIVGDVREIDFTFGKVLMTFRADDGRRTCKYNLSEIELLEFSGKIDDNEKEIYEGNILKGFGAGIKYFKLIVEDAQFVLYNNYGKWGPLYRFFEVAKELGIKVEIIGSIHETPELLS